MNGVFLTRAIRYVFVASDLVVGLLLLVVSMNAITGVHMGVTFQGVVIGVVALSLAVATLAAGYAVAKNLPWQRLIRGAVYLALFLIFGILWILEQRSLRGYGTSFAWYALFSLGNFVAYALWCRSVSRRTREPAPSRKA